MLGVHCVVSGYLFINIFYFLLFISIANIIIILFSMRLTKRKIIIKPSRELEESANPGVLILLSYNSSSSRLEKKKNSDTRREFQSLIIKQKKEWVLVNSCINKCTE